MMILIIVPLLSALIESVLLSPILYDQRQTGKTNVHIDLKDVVLIEMLGGDLGGDYDYSYDYSDLTVKPEDFPTSTTKPTTATESVSSTSSTTIASIGSASLQNSSLVLETDNNTLTFNPGKPNNTSEPNKLSLIHNQQPLNSQNYQIPVVVVQESRKPEKQYVSSSDIRRKLINSSGLRTEELPLRRCSAGFFLDSRNRCKKIKKSDLPQRERPQLPFGLRFAQRPEMIKADLTRQ